MVPHLKPNELSERRQFFSRNQTRQFSIENSTSLQNTNERAIGLYSVGEELGLRMGMTWNHFHDSSIIQLVQREIRIFNNC